MDNIFDVQIITNTKTDNHLTMITDLIQQSHEVWMAVAFIKKSGLFKLKESILNGVESGTKFNIICGLDLFITEPEAIRYLYDWIQPDNGNNMMLMPINSENLFHSKMYCFHKSGGEVALLIGSANLTSGGITTNVESSLLIHTTQNSQIYNQTKKFFEECKNLANIFTEYSLSQYTRKFKVNQRNEKKSKKVIEEELRTISTLKEKKIEFLLNEYLQNLSEQQDFAKRCKKYIVAREVLNDIITMPISSENEFLYYYEQLVKRAGYDALWHSGSLFRSKNEVAKRFDLFIEMVKDIKRNLMLSPPELFEIGLVHKRLIYGVGVNVMTEIMNTFAPSRFPVLNNNPITCLKYFGFENFPTTNSFKPSTYKRYSKLLSEIKSLCDFSDLGEVDHFFNFIYWKYAKK